ncbi:MAG: alpha/beta hydrolase [Actinomycetota bacterium]|nr:alpha/beta hydrolase [Actinomycetota bacterium]
MRTNGPSIARTTMFVEHNGLRLAYETAGSGNPAIVMVHGWACNRSYFAPQFDHFAAHRTVVSVDLRGHGDSDHPEPGPGVYDIDTLCDDVLAVAAAAGCESPVVVGHSLGALVALGCAARGGAGAAIMVDPAPIVSERGKAFFGRAADASEADADRSWRTRFVSGLFLPTDTVRREEIISGMPQQPPAIAAALLRAIALFDGASALGAVAGPLLSIGAAVPSDIAADLRRACPTMTIGQTVGAGHFNQLEVPDQVNVMIDRFLSINGV